MSFIITLIILMLLADAWWWYAADRLLRPLPHARWWRGALAVFMSGCIGGLLLVLASRFSLVSRDAFGPAMIGGLFIWHFLLLPVVAIPSVLFALVRGITRLIRSRANPRASEAMISPPSPSISRRQMLGASLAAAPPLFTIGGTLRSLDLLDEFRIRRLTIPLAGLPPDLDGLTLAQVSDIHVGSFTRGRTLAKIVEATNSLNADVGVQTGDLINHALADLPAGIDMSRRMVGRYGYFMCEGNHDLIESRLEFERRAAQAALPMLINNTHEVRIRGTPVQFLGLRWGSPAGMSRDSLRRSSDESIAASMSQLLAQRRDDAFAILLAHHPHAFDVSAAHNILLTLSGHTHGGQLHLSNNLGFGAWMFRYWSGLYRRNDAALVVSNGVGNWFPLRINAPAEIVHITLRRA